MPSSTKAAADDAIKKYREASAANLSVLAKGNVSRLQKYLGAQNEHPKNFAWMVENAPQSNKENENNNENNAEPRHSEYKENFKQWPLSEIATVPQPSKWSPNSLFPNEIDASKWASEHKAMYSDLTTGELEQGVAAGVATRTTINCPTFFAWKRNDIVKNEATPIESASKIIEEKEDVSVPEPQPEPVEIKEEAAAVSVPCEVPIQKIEESPLVSYEDAIDASKWKSEYDTNFMMQKETEASAVAGVASKSETGHPSNFAWEGINLLPPPPPPTSTDNIFKHDNDNINSISEYAENFQRSEVPIVLEKSYTNYETSAPIPIYSDHINTANWKSEYSSNFNPNKVCIPPPVPEPAPVPEVELALIKEEDSVNDYNEPDTDYKKDIEDTYVIVDSSSIPKFIEEGGAEEVATATEFPVPSPRINSSRSNMENILYFPKTELVVASQEASNVEPAKARKLWFTSEQREQYQWPTAHTLKQKEKSIGPVSSKENIFAICQNLDGTEFKSKSSLTIGPKMTTETRSMFAWPDPAMVIKRDIIKAPKSQMTIGGPKADEIIEKTVSSTFSADSIVPIVAPAQTEVAPAPPVPIISRQREVVEEKAAPSEISSVSAPRKTYSLQLQDSAAAMRIAKATGLRLDEQKMISRPRSAPIRRTSSLVADQIIAAQTKKGSVDSFNPILMHRRFPSSSDKQIGRWRTETKSSFVWSKKK